MLHRHTPFAVLAATALIIAGPVTANVAGTANLPVVEKANVDRAISLAELGFADGVVMNGLSATRELFFPVPRAASVRSLRLRLPYDSGSAFDSRRSLTVKIAGRPIQAIALSEAGTGVVDIPLSPNVIRNGFVPITLRYDGAITDDRCVDERISGAFLSFDPLGMLVVGLDEQAMTDTAEIASIMPADTYIALPGNASPDQAAAAMTLAAGNPQARIGSARDTVTAAGYWRRGIVTLGQPSNTRSQFSIDGGLPQFVLSGSEPVMQARELRSQWRMARRTPSEASRKGASARTPDRLTFGDLGGDTSVQQISDRGSWRVALPMTALPSGQMPSRLNIDVAVARDGSETPPVIGVLMNGLLLGSVEAESGGRTSLDLAIPNGLIAAENDIEVTVTRQVRAGDCAYSPQGYDAQLLPSSTILFKGARSPMDFGTLAPLFADGVTVVLPGPQFVAGTSRLLTTFLDGAVPIAVSFGADAPAEGPYVYVSDTPPPNAEPILRLGDGSARIVDRDGVDLVSPSAISYLTAVQLIDDGGRPILWIRPGRDFDGLAQADNALPLLRGDVALLDSNGVALAFSTTRDRLVDIHYPERGGFMAMVERYRLWLIVIAWVIASAGFVYLLRQIYKARRQPPPES